MGGLSRTKYIIRNTPEEVTVIRRHHPLRGQQFEVLQGGKELITVRLTDGTPMRIPRHWTDADGAPPADTSPNEFALTVESLRRLIELVDAFFQR